MYGGGERFQKDEKPFETALLPQCIWLSFLILLCQRRPISRQIKDIYFTVKLS